MRLCLLLCVVFLASCNTGGLGFAHLPATTVREGGSTFDIRVNGQIAEAIRTNFETLPRYDAVAARSKRAVERATGCKVAWVIGDPSVQRMGLACHGRAAPPAPRGGRSCDFMPISGKLCR